MTISRGRAYEEKGTGLTNAYQVVQIHDVKKFVKLGNAALGDELVERIDNPQKGMLPMLLGPASYPLTEKKIRDLGEKGKYHFIDFKNAAIELNLPADPTEKPTINTGVIKRFFSASKPSTETLATESDFLIQHPISVAQREDGISLTLGHPESRTNKIAPRISTQKIKDYTNNLRASVEKDPLWRGALETSSIVQEFQSDPAAFAKDLGTSDAK